MSPLIVEPSRMQADPLATWRWTHRLLVIDVPDTASGRQTLAAFRKAVDAEVDALLDRDLLIVPVGDLPRPRETRRPWVDLPADARQAVRRQLGMQGSGAELVLVGKDGGAKARQAGTFDLPRVFTEIDAMPMRRAERKQP
ncbi:DUF4174 domain-containing protein [Luteitalea sp. TBR-22]|uniref:DUF4174 domain-containing protein n=1 Tax=Luteitalea sp. TBR-22 TaxID=2802971 RepID=UPI001EF5F92F|nr:DUF4174 domain-containing protein [Luteitalea sp. TBR-22]